MGNFSWNLCGRLSPQCHKYFRRMECFYQCSPFVNQWKHPMRHSGISRAPICAPFCDSFYEACKDDLTCVKDWLNGFVMEKGWKNECPKDSTCKKFSEVYRNGDDMCSTMWGDSLQYTKTKNCLEVDFEGTNPNWRVHKTTEKGTFKKNNNYFSKVLALLVSLHNLHHHNLFCPTLKFLKFELVIEL